MQRGERTALSGKPRIFAGEGMLHPAALLLLEKIAAGRIYTAISIDR